MTYLTALILQLLAVALFCSPLVRWFIADCMRPRMVVEVIDGQAVARRRRVLNFNGGN